MEPYLAFTQYARFTPLFTAGEARDYFGKDKHNRSVLNLLHRLKNQGRVHLVANGVYAGAGARAAAPLNRYRVPQALRDEERPRSRIAIIHIQPGKFSFVIYEWCHCRRDTSLDSDVSIQ